MTTQLYISQLIKWLQLIIPISAIIPIAQNLLNILREDEQTTMYRRRIRNIIIFVILSEIAGGLFDVISRYIHL